MAEPRRHENLVESSELDETRGIEEHSAPLSSDRHDPKGRAGDTREEIDPDSALSDVDRDDTVDD